MKKNKKRKLFNRRQANKDLPRTQNNNTKGILTAVIGFGIQTGEIIWGKLNADTEEGRAFLRLCLSRKMRKREFERLLYLTNREDKNV